MKIADFLKNLNKKKTPSNCMQKVITVFSLFLLLAASAMAQSQLSEKQIKKRNYQEVLGDLSSTADSLVPDKYAMYPGGLAGVQNHISNTVKYPKEAKKQGIEGRVLLSFIIEQNGEIEEVETISSDHPDLEAEAIRVVKKFKTWVPAFKDGKPVRVEYKLPFRFQL